MIWISLLLISFLSAITRKFERICGLFSFLGIGYLVGTPNYQYNGDAVVYMNSYATRSNQFEKGYNWLTNIASNQFDYATFRLYSSLILYVLIFIVILMFTKHVTIISFFYAIAMFPFDNDQVRNAMASLFILLGAYFLIRWDKKGIIPAFIIIFIGSLFHSLALFFLLLPVIWIIRKSIQNHFKSYFVMLSIVALVFEILGSSNLLPFLTALITRFSSRVDAANNMSTIYNAGSTNLLIWSTFYAITLYFIVTGYTLKKGLNNKYEKYYSLFLCSFILWTSAFILLTISVDYVRILRVVSFFYIILIAKLMSESFKTFHFKLYAYSFIGAILLMAIQIKGYGLSLETIKSIIAR